MDKMPILGDYAVYDSFYADIRIGEDPPPFVHGNIYKIRGIVCKPEYLEGSIYIFLDGFPTEHNLVQFKSVSEWEKTKTKKMEIS
jgi:hypothetical protein